ncbi:MAG: hypothetical protein ACLR2F_08415 [Akkermansia muciniphila]
MKINTAFNPGAPGDARNINIIHERLSNIPPDDIIKNVINNARKLVEGLSRVQLEALAGSLVTEILLAQGLGCSEIPLKNLEQMMGMAGVCTKCEFH